MDDQSRGAPDQATMEAAIVGRPWWKVCCMGCLAFIVISLISVYMAIRVFSGTGSPQKLDSLPASFPKDVVVYRPEEVDEIQYYPASSKNKNFNIITEPLKALGQEGSQLSKLLDSGLKNIKDTDTVTIHWSNVDAPREDVIRFFAGAMKQAGIGNPQMKQTSDAAISNMIGLSADLSLKLLVIDRSETKAIDSMTFVVEYPSLPTP